MAGDDPGVREQPPQVRRTRGLTGMGAQRLQVRGEHRVGPHQRLHAHRGGDVRGAQQHLQVVAGQHQHPEHAVGAVDQREPLLLPQRHRLDPGRDQRVPGRPAQASRVAHHALAGQRQGAGRQRRQVARAAQRAVLRDDGRDPGREQRGVPAGGAEPDARPTGRQGREPQQLHGADDLPLDLGARSRRVRAHQAALQLGPQPGRDVPVGQRTEPGGHAVVRDRIVGQRLHDGPAGPDGLLRLGRQLHARAVAGHGDHRRPGHRSDPHRDARRAGSGAVTLRHACRNEGLGRHIVHRLMGHPFASRPRGPPGQNHDETTITLRNPLHECSC